MTAYPERNTLEKFLILNFLEITERIGEDKERVLALFKSIRKELDNKNINNNKVVAFCNDVETCWIFEIHKYEAERDFYYLEFEGIAR